MMVRARETPEVVVAMMMTDESMLEVARTRRMLIMIEKATAPSGTNVQKR
jgi:hypothetical protein